MKVSQSFTSLLVCLLCVFTCPCICRAEQTFQGGSQGGWIIKAWLESSEANWDSYQLICQVHNSSPNLRMYDRVGGTWPLEIKLFDKEGRAAPMPRQKRELFRTSFASAPSTMVESVEPGKYIEIRVPLTQIFDIKNPSGARLRFRWDPRVDGSSDDVFAIFNLELPDAPVVLQRPANIPITVFPEDPEPALISERLLDHAKANPEVPLTITAKNGRVFDTHPSKPQPIDDSPKWPRPMHWSGKVFYACLVLLALLLGCYVRSKRRVPVTVHEMAAPSPKTESSAPGP